MAIAGIYITISSVFRVPPQHAKYEYNVGKNEGAIRA
jgi:hypothetical protein